MTLTTGTGTLSGTASMNAVAGVANFTGKGLNINLVGTDKVLTATATIAAGTKTTTTSPAFTITYAAASQLVFTTQPSSSTVAGVAFAQQPVVTIEDQYGNTVTSGSDATVSVALTLTTGTGTLSGTASMNAVAGVANFTGKGLNINLVGTDKVLTATATIAAGTKTTTTSPAFTITYAAASQLVFTTQPGGGMAGTAWAQQPVVTIEDQYGNTVTSGSDATVSVALTLTTGTGTLSGTTSMNAVAGVANFTGKGLKINLAGTNKVLTATATVTAGTKTTTSSAFTITAPAYGTSIGTTSGTGTGTTLILTTTGTVSVGNTIIVAFAELHTTGTVSAVDSAGNTYHNDVDVNNTSGSRTVILSAPVTAQLSSGGTITVTFPTATSRVMSVFYVSGLVQSASALDRTHSGTGNNASPSSGATTTTSQASEILIGAISWNSNGTMTVGSGFTLGTAATISSLEIQPEYEIVSTTSAYTATGTITSHQWAAVIATYKGN